MSHIGLDQDGVFDVEKIPSEWRDFLNRAGIEVEALNVSHVRLTNRKPGGQNLMMVVDTLFPPCIQLSFCLAVLLPLVLYSAVSRR